MSTGRPVYGDPMYFCLSKLIEIFVGVAILVDEEDEEDQTEEEEEGEEGSNQEKEIVGSSFKKDTEAKTHQQQQPQFNPVGSFHI